MSDYRRAVIPGGTYFFTVVTFDRTPFLTTELARACLRSAWKDVSRRHSFRTDAICLLPDHLHCIWTLPEGDTNFSGRWNAIKGIFSKRYLAAGGRDGIRNSSRTGKGEAALWQRRFWEHAIWNDGDLRAHMDYIHFNPVRHGHVRRPLDWLWSSFHRYVRLGWYDRDWGEQEPASLQNIGDLGE